MLGQQRPALHFTWHPGKGGPPDPGSHSAQQVGYVSTQLPPPEGGGSASHHPTCQAEEQEDLHGPASSRAVQVLAGQVTTWLPATNVTYGAPAALWTLCSALHRSPSPAPWRGQILLAAREAGANMNPEEEMGTKSLITCPRSQS